MLSVSKRIVDRSRCQVRWENGVVPTRTSVFEIVNSGWIALLSSLKDFAVQGFSFLGLASQASAPVKAIELSGESPDRGNRYHPVANGNCAFNRKGGEQPKANEQSVMKVNSIRPSLSGSVLVNREPLTPRNGPRMTSGQPHSEFNAAIGGRWSGLYGEQTR